MTLAEVGVGVGSEVCPNKCSRGDAIPICKGLRGALEVFGDADFREGGINGRF